MTTSAVSTVCSGCSCLCDDIEQGGDRGRYANLCGRGTALFCADPLKPLIAGTEVPLQKAIGEAARILGAAKMPVIYGLENSTTEAQEAGIGLAGKLGLDVDMPSAPFLEEITGLISRGELPTCRLDEIPDKADLLVYWGSNPVHTHPRHLSKFTYYSYTDYDPAGWVPKKVKLCCVDARESEFSRLCRPRFIIKPGEDATFIRGVLEESEREDSRQFLDLVNESSFCVIFCGGGLGDGLGQDSEPFVRLVRKLVQGRRLAVVPMVAGFNSRSLYQLRKDGGAPRPFGRRMEGSDGLLVSGWDPYACLPRSLAGRIPAGNLVCIDRSYNLTARMAHVFIPVGIPGLDCAGSALRMDGTPVQFQAVTESDLLSEEAVLRSILEGLA